MAPLQQTARPRRKDRLRNVPDWWLFLTKFFRQGTAVGAVAPSSPWFARRLIEEIDFASAHCVVELGAGTGPVTAEILRRAPSTCRALIIERDPDFCNRLREHFPQAEVIEADACDLETLLGERGVAVVDHVICGLALPWFAPADRHRLLDAVRRHLAPAGTFRQLTYMPWIHATMYRKYFREVSFRVVLRNLPPGGFYLCRGS